MKRLLCWLSRFGHRWMRVSEWEWTDAPFGEANMECRVRCHRCGKEEPRFTVFRYRYPDASTLPEDVRLAWRAMMCASVGQLRTDGWKP